MTAAETVLVILSIGYATKRLMALIEYLDRPRKRRRGYDAR